VASVDALTITGSRCAVLADRYEDQDTGLDKLFRLVYI